MVQSWRRGAGITVGKVSGSMQNLLSCRMKVWASQVSLEVKNLPAKAGDKRDVHLMPGSGRVRKIPWSGKWHPLQYSCLKNSIGRETWIGKILWGRDSYPVQYSWAYLMAQLVKKPSAMQETWVQSLGWENILEKGKATTPVVWPGESHGLYSLWSGKESDTTEQLSLCIQKA